MFGDESVSFGRPVASVFDPSSSPSVGVGVGFIFVPPPVAPL
jgi:hypothetical protein